MLGWKRIFWVFGLLIVLMTSFSVGRRCVQREGALRIGSKNFTEQVIIAEVLAQLIEKRLGLPVERKFNLGGTFVCFNALKENQLDLYVEYTGTALTTLLGKPALRDPDQVYRKVKKIFSRRWQLVWLGRFGFNNAYTLTMRRSHARRLGIRRISDLGAHRRTLRAGFDHEFLERADGYPGLVKHYGFRFAKRPREFDAGLMYKAISEGQVDVISGFLTDGRIPAFDLQVLEDDRHFFPPYHAAPVVRRAVLDQHPEIARLVKELEGKLNTRRMMQLNHRVDVKGESPAQVARSFLKEMRLLEPSRESGKR